MLVLIYLSDDLPPRSESSQYFVSCATMLLRHNRRVPNVTKAVVRRADPLRILSPRLKSIALKFVRKACDDRT